MSHGGTTVLPECSVCSGKRFTRVFYRNPGYFSDGGRLEAALEKEECLVCGTVRTRLETDLASFYKHRYAPSRNTDTVAILGGQEVTRSRFVYEWITELLEEDMLASIESIMEVGCGQGYLLEQFDVPKKHGIEPGTLAAVDAAKRADVRCMGFEGIDSAERYDAVLSYCVIEHVESPTAFLEKCHDILNTDGLMILALPIQDRFNYDLLFADHLHHFHDANMQTLLHNLGFKVENFQLGKGSYTNIALYICRKTESGSERRDFRYIHNENIQHVNTVLERMEQVADTLCDTPLYAFGFGEIAHTVVPYTGLDKCIDAYVDDYAKSDRVIGSKRSKELFETRKTNRLVLLVNPAHTQRIKALYSDVDNLGFIDFFEGIGL